MLFKFVKKVVSLMNIILIKAEYGHRIVFGKNFSIRKNVIIRIKRTGKVVLGDNVFFNNFCSINCMDSIIIGNNCIFGENVRIYDHNHCYKDLSIPVYKQGFSTKPVVVGDNCWIGSNVIVLPGVTIGKNSVIGCGVIVYKDIPENSLVINIQNLKISNREDI